jgi:hypothetical protein
LGKSVMSERFRDAVQKEFLLEVVMQVMQVNEVVLGSTRDNLRF